MMKMFISKDGTQCIDTCSPRRRQPTRSYPGDGNAQCGTAEQQARRPTRSAAYRHGHRPGTVC